MKDKYIIKKGFMLRHIADSYVVVAVGKASKEFNGMINLNESGAYLWSALEKVHTKEELIKEMQKEYEVSDEIASKDIDYFLQVLEENGILE